MVENKNNKQKSSRGELAAFVLDSLVRGALTTRALFLANMTSARSSKILSENLRKEFKKSERDYHDFLEWQRFYNLISRLKKQGLIRGDSSKWAITNLGKEKLNYLKSKILPPKSYSKQRDDQLKIVSFDIPEKERNKRDWLRSVLKELDFYKLQHSVWIGKNQLPKKFIEDLENLNILSKIHIFSISQEGTLSDFPINLN